MIELTEAAQTVEFRLLILAFLILAGPIVAERLNLPGLIGLIPRDASRATAAVKKRDRVLSAISGGAG